MVEDEFQQLFEKLPVGLLVIHRDGHLLLSNSAAAKQLGSPCTPQSKSPLFLPPGQHQVPSPSLEEGPLQVTVHHFQWRGEGTYLALLEPSQSVGWTSQDTEQLAYEDPLTGLPNLNILKQFIEFTCTQALRYQRSASLILVDVDDFTGLNQQLGQTASDQFLIEIATRLQQTVRSSDLVGRRSQDQFIVLLTELTDDRSKERAQDEELSIHARASRVAERILREFETPFVSRDVPVTCRLSLGVTVCPQEAKTPEEMLHQAEVALLHAKKLGGERFVVYDGSLDLSIEKQHDLTSQVTQALRAKALALRMEPWWELENDRVLAYQALPQMEQLGSAPLDIWALAEQEGFLAELFEWVIKQLPEHQEVPVVLPLSSSQLLHRELPASLQESFAQAGLKPQEFILQVSESAILHDLPRRITLLRSLREQGFQIALDIGGTALGSVQLLHQLRPDWLRISSRSSIFPSMYKIASALRLDVLAHEVDDPEQATALCSVGVRAFSGKARG